MPVRPPTAAAPPPSPSPAHDRPACAWPAAQYGHKTANLAQLQAIVGDRARVPAFCGISDAQVRAFLGRGCEPALAGLQRQLQRDHAAGRRDLSPLASQRLEDVRRAVDRAFSNAPGIPGGEDVALWIAGQHPAPLMVRSTGREDTDELANAGGNESVVNVAATVAAVKAAMARVVSSYFSDHSLQQRMAAGDDVRKDPFVPVLLQRMVGEEANGHVPSAGVLFSREAEGPTPGVSHIQATFGHNEAVVTSRLPADSFLVDKDAVHRVVRRKPQRLAPATGGGLKPARNTPAQRTQPAISDDTARRLHDIGQSLERNWGGPVDVEWSYDPQSNEIYLLQARPLVGPRKISSPNHVAPEHLASASVVQGDVVGAGGGTVRVLAKPETFVVANTLDEALKDFLLRPQGAFGPDRGVQAVFVAEKAEAASHEATTLRGLGVPVVRAASLQAVRQALQGGGPALLDAQSGTLLTGAGLVTDGVPAPGVVRPGWSRHPLPPRESFPALFGQASGASVTQLAQALATGLGVAPPPQDQDPLPALFALLQSHGAPGAGRAPGAALRALASATTDATRARAAAELLWGATQLVGLLRQESSLQARANALLQASFAATGRALAAAGTQGHGSLAFLYELGWLSAALVQPASDYALATDSLRTLLGERKELRALAVSAGAGEPFATARQLEGAAATVALAAARVAKLAQQDEVRAAWQTFAAGVQAVPGGNQALARLLLPLQTQGVTAVWLNTVFVAAWAQNPAVPPVVLAARLFAEVSASAGEAAQIYTWLDQTRQATATWQQRQNRLADPTQALQAAEDVVRSSAALFGEESAARYVPAPATAKLLALGALERAVAAYDASLKAVSGSTALDPVARVQVFGVLLDGYSKMLGPWLVATAPRLANDARIYDRGKVSNEVLVRNIVHHLAIHRGRVETELRLADGGKVARRELVRSELFNVAAAQLGAPTDFTQQGPATLEDYFTLVHQSLLQVVSSARQELGLTHERLAPELRSFVQALLPTPEVKNELRPLLPRVVGIELEPGQTTVRLNASLREHGLALQLTQRQNAPGQLQAHVEIYSEYDEGNRNLRALLAAELLAVGVGGRIDPDVRSTFTPQRPVARWQWTLPIDGQSAPLHAARVGECLRYIAATSYDVTLRSRRLSVLLEQVSRFVPQLEQHLDTLDGATFRRAPWYNEQFFAHYVATERTHTPGFAALCAAIDAAPEGQDRRWAARSSYNQVEEGPHVANARQLLAAWRSAGAEGLATAQRGQPPPKPPARAVAGGSNEPADGPAPFFFFDAPPK